MSIGDSHTADGVEYVVAYDGSHNGQDDDLLSPGINHIVDKRLGVTVARRDSPAGIVAAVLEQHAPLTMRQIAAQLGVTLQMVNGGIYALRQQGRLGARPVSARSPMGRPQNEYWLVKAGRA